MVYATRLAYSNRVSTFTPVSLFRNLDADLRSLSVVAKVDGGLDFPGGLTQFKKRFSVVNIILIAFGGGSGGGGSVDFDRDRFLAFVVVAAIVF